MRDKLIQLNIMFGYHVSVLTSQCEIPYRRKL